LGKYHKSNLYHESQFDKGKGEAVTFKALGTTFGLLVCFDILHGTPVKELLRKGVKNFVLSNWWVNKPPIIAAVQIQQGWSRWNQVNLLAPNAGTNWFNSGSGIYSKGVELAYFYNPTSQSKDMLLIADVNDDVERLHQMTPNTLIHYLDKKIK
jgi:predicted amidohydrolase